MLFNLLCVLWLSFSSLNFNIHEDTCESYDSSNIVECVNPSIKNAYSDGDYVYFGISEVSSFDYFKDLTQNLLQYSYFYNTGTTIHDLFNGTDVEVTLDTPIQVGHLSTAGYQFNTFTTIIKVGMSFEFSYAAYDEMTLIFTRQDNTKYKFIGRYYYSDSQKVICAYNVASLYLNDAPFVPTDEAFRFSTSSTTRSILPIDFNFGNTASYQEGYSSGYSSGYNVGYDEGGNIGYQNGYTEGYNDASGTNATASTIFTGILDVALIPVNVFLAIFNFDVFGVNIAGIVSALLTVSVVIIIFRFLFGGKKDD